MMPTYDERRKVAANIRNAADRCKAYSGYDPDYSSFVALEVMSRAHIPPCHRGRDGGLLGMWREYRRVRMTVLPQLRCEDHRGAGRC